MWPTLLHLGPIKVPGYGFMLGVGILIGIFIAKKEAVRRGVDPMKIESLAFWTVLMSVFGARFLYVFIEHGDEYWPRPWEFFYFQRGGLAFSGSLVAALATIFVFSKKEKINFWTLTDILTPSVSLGLMFGKLGCLLAGCCYGKVCDLAWGIKFHNPESLASPKDVPLHPTQIYEAICWFALFWLLLWFRKKERKPGEVFFLFAVAYGSVRFFLEYLRADPGYLGPLTTAQMTNLPLVVLAAYLWVRARKADRIRN